MAFNNIHSLDIETTALSPRESLYASANGISDNSSKVGSRIWGLGIASRTPDGSAIGLRSDIEVKDVVFDVDTYQKSKEWSVISKDDFYRETASLGIDPSKQNELVNRPGGITESVGSSFTRDAGGNYKYSREAHEAQRAGIARSVNAHTADLKPGMILIQNSRFERDWLSSIETDDVKLDIHNKMLESSSIGGEFRNNLSRPAKVREQLDKLRNEPNIHKQDKIYDAVMLEYARADELANKHGKFYVADLMDFTKAAFTKAAAQGHISEGYTKYGANIEFLSRLLLGEKETHNAASDATQQIKIFDRVRDMWANLKLGIVSPEDQKVFDKMNEAEPALREMMSAKSYISNYTKLNNTNELDASNQSGTRSLTVRENFGDGKEFEVRVASYERVQPEYAADRVIHEITKNDGTFVSEAVRQHSNAAVTTEEKIDVLKNDGIKDLADKTLDSSNKVLDNILLGEKLSDEDAAYKESISIASTLSEEAEVKNAKAGLKKFYHNNVKTLPGIGGILPDNHVHGLVGLGLAAAGAGLYLASDSGNTEKIVNDMNANRQRLRDSQYAESVFNQYRSGIQYEQIPAGVGKANWENRNRHHEY